MKLNISNIQHFSVGDGQGIRTTVFFKGCNLRCPWCHNPENLSADPVILQYKELGEIKTAGRIVPVSDILPQLLEDKDFFAESGGGITLSGGEVMLQPEGALELVQALKSHGISVLIDTAGCVPYGTFQKLNPVVDGYLYDFKTADPEKYRSIGGNLKTVSDNLKRLLTEGVKIQIRIPLLPAFNTDPQSIADICAHLKALGISQVELLPFHRLGSSKYEAMGLDYSYKQYEPFSKEELEKIENQYANYFEIIKKG